MVKNKLLVLLLLCIAQIRLAAQKSIQLTQSFGSSNYVQHLLFSGINFFGEQPKNTKKIVSLNITYKDKKNSKWHTGVNIGYEYLTSNSDYVTGYKEMITIQSKRASAELYRSYNAAKSSTNFYGFMGLGLESTTRKLSTNNNKPTTTNELNLAWQITPLGLEATFYKKWKAVVEIGYGYKGIMCMGIQYNFE